MSDTAAGSLAPAAPPVRRAPGGRAAGSQTVVIYIYAEGWGGMEIHTVDLVRELVSRGHRCVIAEIGVPMYAGMPVIEELGVAVVTLTPQRPLDVLTLREWLRLIRPVAGDVAIFAKGAAYTASFRFELALRLRYGRYMTIEHLTPPPQPVKKSKRHLGGLVPGIGLWWYSDMLELVPPIFARSIPPRRIVGVSHAVIEELRAYGFPRRKLVAVPNGIDSDRFRPDPLQRIRSRAAWGLDGEMLVFGTVARLNIGQKGQDIALRLVRRLADAHPDRPFRYVMVGEGESHAKLQAQVDELGLRDRVIFGGYTDRPWEAHAAMDVFLMPSRFEGIGLSLLEAMACGAVPVAFGVGGVRDVITRPELGWLVPANDEEGFYRGMEAALQASPAERSAMAAAGRRHVERHFRSADQFRKLADVVERCGR
jgi:glycosyltransferase involved in cell wall biosynthesis